MRRNSKGFSLIELLIVVAIILIIAAIAIPDLLKSRQAANQASAVGSLRTINTAEVTYSSTYTYGFSSTLLALGPPATPGDNSSAANLIDSVLAAGIKSTYEFAYFINPASPAVPQACVANTAPPAGGTPNTPPVTNSAYSINASPLVCPTVAGGGNYYFTDQSGVIRQNTSTIASPGDAPLAG